MEREKDKSGERRVYKQRKEKGERERRAGERKAVKRG